jgi:hypothetical protein
MFGSPLRTSDLRISGAGHLTGGFASSCCDIAAGVSRCARGGPENTGDGIDLYLLAESSTTITWQVRLSAPPWVPELTGLGWVVTVPAVAADPSQLTRYHVGPQVFTIAGPTGVDIRLAAEQALGPPHTTRSCPTRWSAPDGA